MDEAFTQEKYLSRAAWLAARTTGLGGTDAAPLVQPGLSKWSSPFSVWASKSGLVPADDGQQTDAQYWGSTLEPLVLAKFAESHGRVIRYRNVIWRNRERQWLLCSPDGRLEDEQELVEVKAVGAHRREEWSDGPPLLYLCQVQHQLAACGWARCHVAVLLGGQDFRTFVVERDDRFIAALLAIEEEFWERNVLGGVAPRIDGDDPTTRTLASLYSTEAPGKHVMLPPEALRLHRRRMRAIDRIDRWQGMVDVSTNRLKEMMGDAAVGQLPGNAGSYQWATRSRKEHVVKASSYREFKHKGGAK